MRRDTRDSESPSTLRSGSKCWESFLKLPTNCFVVASMSCSVIVLSTHHLPGPSFSGAKVYASRGRNAVKRFTRRRQRDVSSSGSAADGEFIDLQGGLTHSNRHRLTVFPAGTHPPVQLEVIANHRDPAEHIRTVADQHRALHWRRHLPILDQVRFARGKDELAGCDVDL